MGEGIEQNQKAYHDQDRIAEDDNHHRARWATIRFAEQVNTRIIIRVACDATYVGN
jgi:hypothetical protein